MRGATAVRRNTSLRRGAYLTSGTNLKSKSACRMNYILLLSGQWCNSQITLSNS
jgi:hypothetical protein